jgi:hypothetical protein
MSETHLKKRINKLQETNDKTYAYIWFIVDLIISLIFVISVCSVQTMTSFGVLLFYILFRIALCNLRTSLKLTKYVLKEVDYNDYK